MTTTIIVVNKHGKLDELTFPKLNPNELYKYAGFKTPVGFKEYTGWKINFNNIKYNIVLYGKEDGRANHENKYEFPPPNDALLLFDNCIILNKNDNGTIGNLSILEWENINIKINKGFFETIDEENYESNDETCEAESEKQFIKKNKLSLLSSGYLDDGFVVEDDDECV